MFATRWGRWSYRALCAVTACGFAVVVGPALFGEQHWNVGALGGFIGAAVGARWRHAEFWRLPRPDRRRVEQAVLTGVPTGSPTLDAVAQDRLAEAVRSRSRGNVIAQVVVAALALGLTLLAWVRSGQPLYLLALVPTLALIGAVVRTRLGREHPADRLLRFDDLITTGT